MTIEDFEDYRTIIRQGMIDALEANVPPYLERRRYALLQAAATILAGGVYVAEGQPQNWESLESSAQAAIALLAEIEKREQP